MFKLMGYLFFLGVQEKHARTEKNYLEQRVEIKQKVKMMMMAERHATANDQPCLLHQPSTAVLMTTMDRIFRSVSAFTALLSLILGFPVAVKAYNSPSCPNWPGAAVWESQLGAVLSEGATLHGPIPTSAYATDCETVGTDAYALSKAGNGICMHAHACKYEFCRDGFGFDLPVYVADVRSPEDVAAALAFANLYDIEVSVKTTGHSYTGSSTSRDSLLIWMQNYPKDGTITENFVDSCGTSHYAVVGIAGGETWNDVLEAVKGDYHVVTGGGRTVSAAGGWLMGGGLSFSSRMYGIGIDQVVEFDLILTDGTMMKIDACSNPDLFWALRGGGGGTFGVVTHVEYKLHPPTPITTVNFFIYDGGNLTDEQYVRFVRQWIAYWVEVSPFLENRWSGFWGAFGAQLVFAGTAAEARESFVNDFDFWYDNVLDTTGFGSGSGILRPGFSMEQANSWYEYKGGEAAYNNPSATDPTGDAYAGAHLQSTRLMPRDIVVDRPAEVTDFLITMILTPGGITWVNYFLGGVMMDVPPDGTAVHPAMRKALYTIHTFSDQAAQMVRDFIPNNVTGVCYNHHSGIEPDWRDACWGSNYVRLESMKQMYDPDRRFNCWHCVGYLGDENPPLSSTGREAVDNVCPTITPSASPQTSPTDAPTSSSSSWLFRRLAISVLVAVISLYVVR